MSRAPAPPVVPRHRERRPVLRAVVAPALVLVAATALTLALTTGTTPEVPAPVDAGAPGSTPPVVAPALPDPATDTARATPPATAPDDAATPTRLAIAAIDVATELIDLGVNPDDTVEVPEDPDLAGWFALGTTPGSPGSAVVLGHVDSADGPAVFARLESLRPGDTVEVDMSNGTTRRFRVDQVDTYANADFPAQAVYAGTPKRRQLTLVTCGGEYDAERGGWQSNVVVYTDLVPDTRFP